MTINYRILVILMAIIILFSFSVEAKEAKLIINDQGVKSDLVIINGRTLVPVEIISEHFGAKLDWNSKSQELRINNKNLTAKLTVGSNQAVVNSMTVSLQAQVRVFKGKVLIPLRFLSKVYGGNLAWEGSTKTVYYHPNLITDISIENFNNKSQVIIKAASTPQYEISQHHQSKQLILDLKKVGLQNIDNVTPTADGLIKNIKVNQFQVSPAVARIVININQMNDYRIMRDGSDLVIEIDGQNKIMASSLTSNFGNSHWKESKKIVIDPGHGGESPGAIGYSGVEEKKVNYQIASRVYQQLKKEGFQVILSRGRGQDLPLLQRAGIANDWPADMFISIHADYNYRSWISGTTTYAHWNASKDNWALAWYVQDEIVKRAGTDSNGLKAANFAVLRGSNVPAILVETAFLSNPKEEYLLTTPAFQRKIAEGVVAGIKRYYYN